MSDTSQEALRGFAEALRKAPARAQETAQEALNEAADYAREKGVEAIGDRYNLDKPYIQKHLTVNQQATRTDLLAKISATHRPVLATRYGAEVAMTSAPNAKGDPYRKIPAGMKAVGSTPWSVLRGGSPVAWQNAFFVRGKVSNAWMMIARQGDWTPGMSKEADWQKNLTAIHSPSVAQGWRYVNEDISVAAMALAQERFLEKAADLLE
ncbi:MAG: hypothetical protein CME38_18925 [Haliea sp.]|nr:hypothetical protein [Haliea sp.]|tara:strand:- start:2651 stop:3277 length:627 start_codon:yes stop_codon:yes gene_type:complete